MDVTPGQELIMMNAREVRDDEVDSEHDRSGIADL